MKNFGCNCIQKSFSFKLSQGDARNICFPYRTDLYHLLPRSRTDCFFNIRLKFMSIVKEYLISIASVSNSLIINHQIIFPLSDHRNRMVFNKNAMQMMKKGST